MKRRIEVFVKIQKKKLGGGGGVRGGGGLGGGGVRMDVNEELKFLTKFKKKFGRGGGRGCRVGVGRVGSQGGCE